MDQDCTVLYVGGREYDPFQQVARSLKARGFNIIPSIIEKFAAARQLLFMNTKAIDVLLIHFADDMGGGQIDSLEEVEILRQARVKIPIIIIVQDIEDCRTRIDNFDRRAEKANIVIINGNNPEETIRAIKEKMSQDS